MELQDDILTSQVNWLVCLILENGEFIMHNEPSDNFLKIIPYFSSISCFALLEHGKLNNVKKYLLWYLSHLNNPDKFNVFGSIYDYKLSTNLELISSNDYDSYDSYPATFLSICNMYYNFSDDKGFFETNRSNIDNVTSCLLAAFDTDNLTWAKPNYKIKYLMDNCEVYNGLVDGANLYKNVYKDNDYYERLYSLSQKVYLSIQKMFYNKKGFYYYQIDQKGGKYKPNFDKWYPDATSQLFPILHQIISPTSETAKIIYERFNKNFPNWHTFKTGDSFPNTYVGYVALIMKDYTKAKIFIDNCINKYIKNNCAWPWFNVECSYFIRTLTELKKLNLL